MVDLTDLNEPLPPGVSTARAVTKLWNSQLWGNICGEHILGGDLREDFSTPEITLLESCHRKELLLAALK